jgi:hypothetical protein
MIEADKVVKMYKTAVIHSQLPQLYRARRKMAVGNCIAGSVSDPSLLW